MSEIKQNNMSLFDLWRMVQAQSKVVIGIFVFFLVLGGVYSFLSKPIYRAEVFMLPPSIQDIQPLNVQVFDGIDGVGGVGGVSGFVVYRPGDVYDVFIQMLQSRGMRKTFFEQHRIAEALGLSSADEDAFETFFNKKIQVKRNVRKKGESGFSRIALEMPDAQYAADWANQFVQEVQRSVVHQLVNGVTSELNARKDMLKQSIASKLQIAKQRRQDRLVALKEALRTAEALSNDSQDDMFVRAQVALNTDHLPLYLLGSPALRAEIKALESREDDAPFVEGLRDLQELLLKLEKVHVSADDVKTMALDQPAFVSNEPVNSKKVLILILSGLIGLILGVMVVFLRQAWRSEKSS